MKITKQWVNTENIPGQHGQVIEGNDEDYRIAKNCAMISLLYPYTLATTTTVAKFPQIWREGSFNLEAHRGFSDEFPENTTVSFEAAGKTGQFQGMETDVQMTKDNVLVCMHDNTLTRTMGISGKVSDYTYAELMEYYITGGNGWSDSFVGTCKIPTFEEFLNICHKYKMIPYVELKLLSHEGILKVIDTLRKNGFEDGSYVLTSFNKDYLDFASTLSDTPLEYLKSSFSEQEIKELSQTRNLVLRVEAKNITESFMSTCFQYNIPVECWNLGVGNKSLLDKIKGWGVKGGTCNSWK